MSISEENLSEKRLHLIESYMAAAAASQDDLDAAAVTMTSSPSPLNGEQLEAEFTAKLFALTRDQLDSSSSSLSLISSSSSSTSSDVSTPVGPPAATTTTTSPSEGDYDRLVETAIRYALAYLEEYDYALKLTGVRLLDHLVDQMSAVQLKMNMRAELVRDTLARYVNDKDSLEFLDKSNQLMIKLLGVIETKFNTNEHYFKQTSAYVETALNNCYMSTNPQVKLVYLKHLKTSLARLGPCACRHLDKQLTVLFDSIELGKINADFQLTPVNTHLVLVSLDLMHASVQACFYRIHSHSRRIIQFLLKLVYSYCLQSPACVAAERIVLNDDMGESEAASIDVDVASDTAADTNNNNNNKENSSFGSNVEHFRQIVCLKSLGLVKMLFRNDRIRCSLYDDFKQVKSDAHLNRSFLKLIENI